MNPSNGLWVTFLYGAAVCIFSFITTIMFINLDKKARKLDSKLAEVESEIKEDVDPDIHAEKAKSDSADVKEDAEADVDAEDDDMDEHKVDCNQVLQLGIGFWMTSFIFMLTYGMQQTITELGSKYLNSRFGYSEDKADMVINSSYLVTAILMPFLGIYVDNHGKMI